MVIEQASKVDLSFAVVIQAFQKQAENPPGKDPCIGACYFDLLSIMTEDPEVSTFLEATFKKRPSAIPPAHFVNLFFRSVQFIKLFHDRDQSYRSYQAAGDWEEELTELFSGPKRGLLAELLLTKDTVTTKYQRYAGPKALLAKMWPGQDLNIADFGCGANYGLRGIELGEPFQEVSDQTPLGNLNSLLSQPVSIGLGYAVDRQDPENPETQAWSMACSYYPSELDQMGDAKDLEQRLKASRRVDFLKADLTDPTTTHLIPKGHFHAVILSTILYQYPEERRDQITSQAKQAIREDGAVIIQDFAEKDPQDPTKLKFVDNWGGNNYTYRTFVIRAGSDEILEVFQWSDGRSTAVCAGGDYHQVFCD